MHVPSFAGGKRKLALRPVIPTVDLSRWIRENTKKEDYVIFKLDVEGAEFDILKKMLAEGTFKWIDKYVKLIIVLPVFSRKYLFLIEHFVLYAILRTTVLRICHKRSMCTLDNTQSISFYLGKFLKKLPDDKCYSIPSQKGVSTVSNVQISYVHTTF